MRIFFIFCLIFLIFSAVYSQENADSWQERLSGFSTTDLLTRNRQPDFFDNPSLIVWGTHTDDEDEIYINQMLSENIVAFRISRWLKQPDNVAGIIPDTLLTSRDIEEYNLILVGTPSANFWLNLLQPVLPITVAGDEIKAAGHSLAGDEVGVCYRYPNPLNPQRWLWVITAPVYEALLFIPKTSEYCLYRMTEYHPNADRFQEWAQGNFNSDWTLTELNLVDNEEVYSGEEDSFYLQEIKQYPSPEWATRGVMYEIFVRSFYDSDGDGIGDLRGITEKLDYLNDGDPATTSDLGIRLIWLMPVLQSPSYHGYDVTNYYRINPDYGTNEDFQELLREAHRRGIRIISDLVLNHCSAQHPFFLDAYGNPDSPYDQWFFFTNTSNTRAHNWQFRHREKDRAMLEPYMPAWNVNNPEVQKYLFDMAGYWLDPDGDGDFSDGIDGFRCDYVKGPPPEFWMNFRQAMKELNPDILLLAENWDGLVSIAASFNDQFDMAFDFPFQGSLIASLTSGSASDLKNLMLEQQRILPENAIMNRFFNNHDMNRIFTTLDEARAKLGFTILLTMPDMPMLYYGDEIGMKGAKDPYDEGIRRPMEWCADNQCPGMATWYPVWNDLADGISVEEQTNDPGSILSYIRDLIAVREANSVLETGDLTFLPVHLAQAEQEDPEYRRAITYLVSSQEEKIIVFVNLHEEISLSIAAEFLTPGAGLQLLHNQGVDIKPESGRISVVSPQFSSFMARIVY